MRNVCSLLRFYFLQWLLANRAKLICSGAKKDNKYYYGSSAKSKVFAAGSQPISSKEISMIERFL